MIVRVSKIMRQDRVPPNVIFLAYPRSQDRKLFAPLSNTAKHGPLAALLDTGTHHQAPLSTKPWQSPVANTCRPQPFQSLFDPHQQPFQEFLYVHFSRIGRFSTRRFSLSADVAVVVVASQELRDHGADATCELVTLYRDGVGVAQHADML
jgi:hypothetical protein